MKKVLIVTAIIIAIIAVITLCVALFEGETDEWKDFYGNDEIYSIELTKEIEDFPGTEFVWTANGVIAKSGSSSKTVIYGFPVWNVFFYDFTGDGYDDLCATVSVEEDGVESDRIVIQDYQLNRGYEISDPGNYNFRLEMKNGELVAVRTSFSDNSDAVNGSIIFDDAVMKFKADGE